MMMLALPFLAKQHSKEARVYSLLLGLSACCFFLYLENLTKPRRIIRVALAVSITVLELTHIFGILTALSYLSVIFLSATACRSASELRYVPSSWRPW